MHKRRRVIISLLVAPVITMVATGCLNQPVAPTGKGGAHQCPTECGVKLEHAPWVYSGSQAVSGVCIKAGTENIGFSQDGSNGCYTVTGLGTTSVSVTGGGTSRYCKDISNVVFYFADCGIG